jgi:energy-coupling factor transporter transmembrane protein EcfT
MAQAASSAVETQSHGKKFVRSFLFSVKIDSPLARLHVGTKLILILVLSIVIVQFIRTDAPDPFGTILLMLLAFLGLQLAGVLRWVFRSYLLVVFPALLGMALTWVIFNPDPGRGVLFTIPVYSGTIRLGLSLGLGIFLFCVIGWYVLRRQIFWGLVGGIILAALVTWLVGNPALQFTQFQFFHPLEILVSGKNLVIAVTKALGYGAMIFVSLLLVMTSRDIEFTGMMMQLRVPYVAAFFVSTMLRSLSMALSDYGTIRQAQVARGISLKKRNVLQVIADLAYIAVPLTATMLRRSSEVGDAILARGFTMQTKNPTEFHETRRFMLADAIVLGICAVLVVATFGFGLNVTRLFGVNL